MSSSQGIELQNRHLLQTVIRSSINLPPVMAIWRHRTDIETGGPCIGALLVSQRIPQHQGTWKLSLMPHPRQFLQNGTVVASNNDQWFGNSQHRILLEGYRSSPEEPMQLFESIVMFNHHVIVLPDRIIPIVRVHHDTIILNPRFHNLSLPENEMYRCGMKLGHVNSNVVLSSISSLIQEANLELAYLNSVQSPEHTVAKPRLLPQRIVNGFLEGMIAKGEPCPIEMEPLKKEESCMTPCGHAMTYAPAKEWVSVHHRCPVCRAGVEVYELQKWMA
jgi:hypothetical protein